MDSKYVNDKQQLLSKSIISKVNKSKVRVERVVSKDNVNNYMLEGRVRWENNIMDRFLRVD